MIAPKGSPVQRRVLLAVLAVLASLLTAGSFAVPALASEGIASFETTMSTNLAGGHPDLVTSFELENPGEPEAAKNVIFNAPQGFSATPTRSPSAPRSSSRSMNAPPTPSPA